MADGLKMEQVQAAMKAMMDKAMETPNEPIAMCIVDAAGNLEAYAKMDNLRIFSRRHAQRKAYTSAVMGMDSGAHAERLHGGGRNIADLGDPMMTHGQGGLVIMKDGVILGAEAERTGLMGLAVRWGLFWTFLFVAVQLFAEGLILWSTGTWSENALLNFLLVPPILFFGVFFYLRRKYLNRADSIWQRVRQREVDLEVQRRMKAA